MNSKVVVIGSCNMDLSMYAPRLPKPGETIHGNKFVLGFGGKGANQCVAAAKLGAATCMLSKLGNDSFGKDFLAKLQEAGVNTDHVSFSNTSHTGMAQITVSDDGENQIVIAAGANEELSPSDVDAARGVVQAAAVVVCQLETPVETTVHALRLRQHCKGVTIVNAAPALANPDPRLLSLCDIFCVNEAEAGVMVGGEVTAENAHSAVLRLLDGGCGTAVITLGARGAVLASRADRRVVHVSAPRVTAVDTTGAGDMFVGALAYYLAYHPGLSLEETTRRACELAALSVLRPGTQSSFPARRDLSDRLFS
ncbi:ribokinase-like [Bacillus rossius redtenbacheri]|uniref:ribokinase-like n=1 Tax=Bacillus rossius redtenbacheri TaxID=93214 RepID=UPI002FDDA57F